MLLLREPQAIVSIMILLISEISFLLCEVVPFLELGDDPLRGGMHFSVTDARTKKEKKFLKKI